MFSYMPKRVKPLFFLCAIWLLTSMGTNSWAIEINDKPMETTITAAPSNIMFIFDNSGSMDWEFMTQDTHDGLFDPNNTGKWWESYLYVFSYDDYEPYDDNNYHYTPGALDETGKKYWRSQWSGYNRIFYNPTVDYQPWPGADYGDADLIKPRSNPANASPVFDLSKTFLYVGSAQPDDDFGNSWHTATLIPCNQTVAGQLEISDDHDVFRINLQADGNLTIHSSGCTDVMGRILDSSGNEYRADEYADTWTDPYSSSNYSHGDDHYYDDDCQNQPFCTFTCPDWTDSDRNFYIHLTDVPAGTYYIDVRGWQGTTGPYEIIVDSTGICETPTTPPSNEPVNILNAHYYTTGPDGTVYLVNFSSLSSPVTRDIYKFTDANQNSQVDYGELERLDPPPLFLTTRSPEQELQNFANWFSYYRRRELTAKAAVSTAISELTGVNVGFYTINDGVRQPVLYLNTHQDELYSLLFSIDSSGGTPLRQALKDVGRYFDADDGKTGNLGTAPWASEEDGGACQQAFAILMTDGYWNGSSPYVGNVDGNDGVPFADAYSNTLADVARYFYDTDLNDSLSNIVPQNACDDNTRQHLVTYGLSFGVHGELNPNYDSYHPCLLGVINNDPNAPPAPQWENPSSCEACGKKIDDLWHAAVNGRGAFISAADPEQLIEALSDIISNINGRMASGAAVSINSEKLTEGSVLYQSSYDSSNWTGDLKAYNLNANTGEISDPVWEAKTLLLDQDWDTGRRIITFNGSSGVPFRLNNLTNTQKTALDSDTDTQEDIVEYIRGREIAGFRQRPVIDGKVDKLGDLVHSAPTLVGHTIFVGGNDGMLHAFDANSGYERFAFVPSNVIPQLKELTQPGYSHKFFVDLTPTVKLNVPDGNDETKTILVGGLGAGGKGYFALDITNADSIDQNSSESEVANMLLWEYPSSGNDPDLGVSLSKISIVKTHNGSYVAIFGNGYNSDNGHAVLYALDLLTGTVVRKIDTGVGDDNGLSTPVVVDVDGDFVADFAYAGDLKGNLWKFDLRGDPGQWKAAFGDKPLFQAVNQPITVRPDVMRHCMEHGYMVVFATGKFLAASDIQDTSVQTIYGIWDYADPDLESEYVGSFNASTETFTPSPELQSNNVQLLKQTITETVSNDGIEYRLFSNNSANWATIPDSLPDHLSNPGTQDGNATVGWYVNLGGPGFEGERAARDIVIRNGKAIVITIIPNDSPCSGGGKSVIYEMDACDGSMPDRPVFDVNGDSHLDDEDYVERSNGNGEPVPPTGRVFETIVHDPVFLRLPDKDQEFKYFSTAQGTIIRIREPADYLGIFYWIEW